MQRNIRIHIGSGYTEEYTGIGSAACVISKVMVLQCLLLLVAEALNRL